MNRGPWTSKTTLISLALFVVVAGCGPSQPSDPNQQNGIIVVNAPANGEVLRILVNEGAEVNAGGAILEIAVDQPMPTTTVNPQESAESEAVRGIRSSQAEIEAARAEVVRHEAEVQRLTPLVASGEASPAQLDGERSLYERAQQRLQKAKDSEQQAQTGLRVARQPGAQTSGAKPSSSAEQIVLARATSGGTVAVISARVGMRVKLGQPLATLRATGTN